MTALALGFTMLLGVLIIALPRKYAIIPFLVGTCFIPMGGKMMIGPADFTATRILVIFAFVRIIMRNEYKNIQFTSLDRAVIYWVAATIITGAVVKRIDTSFIYRLGQSYNALGYYFALRCWINSKEDVIVVAKSLCFILLIVALEMIQEQKTGRNLFAHLGGIPYAVTVRDGELRSQGAFAHAILAGTVGASSIGLFLFLYVMQGNKKLAVLGLASSIGIVMAANSSGPIMTVLILLVGLGAWRLRHNMKGVRWGILIGLIVLEITMESHVWYLIARVDLTGSSTGWHRAELINSAVYFFEEWWLWGTDRTRHWMPTGVTWSPYHTDITNEYIKNGVNGGVITLLLFVNIIVQGYRSLGRSMSVIPLFREKDKLAYWVLGAVLFAHTITFLSIRYFDQSIVFFYLLIAIISQYTRSAAYIPFVSERQYGN